LRKASIFVVDLGAQPGNLALRDAGHSHRPHQLVDRSGRDAVEIGFLDSWMTAVSAFSAIRRGSRKAGK
jgi:hypothetical protein